MQRIYSIVFLLLVIVSLTAYIPSITLADSNTNIVYEANPLRMFVSTSVPSIRSNICIAGTIELHCYTPQVIQKAYNFLGAYKLVGGYSKAGAGQTIVIIDAYGSPTIRQDLQTFDQAFGLPSATLNIICPQGCPTFNPKSSNEVGWSFETTLDVEYSHAMAPAATIDLVVASSNFGNDINNAEGYALSSHLGSIWSQSFGAAECFFQGDNSQFVQSQQIQQEAVNQGVTLIASAGDSGAQEGCPNPTPIYPSSNPNDLAVGGTRLLVNNDGSYKSETTWNDYENTFLTSQNIFFGVTGGAPSIFFSQPSWQNNIQVTPYSCTGSTPSSCSSSVSFSPSTRITSDVSYDAGVDGGVLAYWGAIPADAGFYIFGGTSAGSPQWAAVIAIADQLHHTSFGLVAPYLYALVGTNSFHDITVGSNSNEPGTGFLSTTGYDPPTGLGSPDVGVLVQQI
ncbi:MAG: S53 family peptidase [Nitrososphaerota archaeon]|nr:S53 family peptidase [Nitrososphaerota archaeon]